MKTDFFRISMGDTSDDDWYAIVLVNERPIMEIRRDNSREYLVDVYGFGNESHSEVPYDGLLEAIKQAKDRLESYLDN